MCNTGLLYNKLYYRNISAVDLNDSSNKYDFADESNAVVQTPLYPTKVFIPGTISFRMKTIYPGLLTGSGYQHQTGGDNEFKVGFHFDYTTGLPCLPGSSVKGVLRSIFPFTMESICEEEKNSRIKYLKDKIKAVSKIDITNDQLRKFEMEVFEGKIELNETEDRNKKKTKDIPLYERDIFYDVFPTETSKADDTYLASDFITHHESPIKDPIPVMFLKVLPEVEFDFVFKTYNSMAIPGFTAENKATLFRGIIEDFGLGAKTNVGYGQFEFVKPPIKYLKENFTREHQNLLRFKSGSQEQNLYAAKVVQLNEHDYLFEFVNIAGCRLSKTKITLIDKFERDLKRRLKKGKNGNYKDLEIGDEVTIRVNKENDQGFNFSVMPIWIEE